MPAQSTTKMQVQAYRFGMRRLENAVSNGQSYKRSLGGPRPNLSFLVGFLLAALVLAGFAVYALISPSPSVGDAKVLIDGDNGGSYVLRGKTLYPALNYSSALLAAGNSKDSATGAAGTAKAKVGVVDADTLAGMPKGRTLGIPGAPNQVPATSRLVGGTWTVCDTSTFDTAKAPTQTPKVSTTVVLGQATRTQRTIGTDATIVTPNNGTNVYLLAFGRAQEINTGDRVSNQAVAVALNSIKTTMRPISAGLLAAIPKGPPLTPPTIDGLGGVTPTALAAGITVGTVFRVQYAQRGPVDYVALSTGVERLTPFLSDLIRARYTNFAKIPYVPLSTLRQAEEVSTFDTADFPSVRPAFADINQDPVICLGWDGRKTYTVYPTNGSPVPHGAVAVQTPAAGHGVANEVYLAPGHGELVGQVVTTGQKPSTGALFLVTDQGVKYPVVNTTALSLLGLDLSRIRGAKPELLGLLPTGPTLDPQAASHYSG